MFILACIVSFVPSIALLLWLMNRLNTNAEFKKLCGKALGRGMLSVIPVILLSAITNILINLTTNVRETNPLLYKALYTFIVLALVEEVVKYAAARHVLKKTEYPCSPLDITILFTIAAIGFGLIESVAYAFGASIPVVLVRGICLPHAGYGFLVGYFYGKGRESSSPGTKWIGFVLAWLIHGLYDFSLSEEFIALNDNLVFVALLLALLDIVLVILLIRYARREKKRLASS